MFGRILPAQLGDMYGVFNVMVFNTLLGGIFILAVWLPAQGNAPLIVFSILYGFTSGCTFSIIPAMIASFSEIRQLGARTGALYCVSSFGALLGSPIAGAIIKSQHDGSSGMIIFGGVILLVGTAFALSSRIALAGYKLRVKV